MSAQQTRVADQQRSLLPAARRGNYRKSLHSAKQFLVVFLSIRSRVVFEKEQLRR